ncbi:MAG: hypothetical protein BGO96_09730 [Micrococcales bacterium 73-15]|nr:MAG: hypothetical protein BGO96_09730 [Micrococcales bacterium 73-15]
MAATFAAEYGLAPDEWQRGVLDDWLSERGARWSALTLGLAVPRQNGKNALLEVRELFGMVGRGEKILHTAHEVKTAQKHFRRLKHFFGSKREDPAARFPELNALVETVRSVNGQEAIFLTNGASIELVARSKNSGRGFTVDVLVMDEAQELSEDALEALLPTTSAAPLGNPQWIYTGTPPGPNAVGEVFTRVRREALGKKPGALAWHEWADDGKHGLDDRDWWARLNPGVDAGRLQMDIIEGERARFSDDGFARERQGRWADDDSAKALVSRSAWLALKRAAEGVPEGRRSYGVKFSADGSRYAVSVAVRPDSGPAFVELLFHESTAAGTAAIRDFLVERYRQAASIVVDGKSHAGAFVRDLIDAGVPKPRPGAPEKSVIVTPSAVDVVAAHAAWLEAVKARTVEHAAQPGLADSVGSSGKRPIGTTGGWGLQPITETGDPTPAESMIFALWGARTSKRRPGRAGGGMVMTS